MMWLKLLRNDYMAIETCAVGKRSHPAEETRPPTGPSRRDGSCEAPANSTGIYQELPVETRLMKTKYCLSSICTEKLQHL